MAGSPTKARHKGVFISPLAEVDERALIGKGTRIWHHAQVREGASIGEDCIIGKDAYIDTGVVIGNRVKIQNGVSVYRGCRVEDDVFLGPHCVTTNDRFPRAFVNDFTLVPTHFRKGCSIGAGAVIVCGVTVGEYALVGAGTVVTKDVPPYGLVISNPGRLIGYVCRLGHRQPIPVGAWKGPETLACPVCARLPVETSQHSGGDVL